MPPGSSPLEIGVADRAPAPHRPGFWARFKGAWRRFLDRRRRKLERIAPGNLARHLIAGGDFRVLDGQLTSVGDDPYFLLPPRRYAPGFYVLIVHVKGTERRGYGRLYVDDGSDFSEERAYGLVTKQEKSVFRIVYLPAGAQALRFDPTEGPGPLFVPLLRFHRVPQWFAARTMRRRIGLEHPRLAGQRRVALEEAILAYAASKNLSTDAALFALYHHTFGSRRSTGDYDAWLSLVEASAHATLDPWPRRRPGPTISVLVPTYETRPEHLRACLDSVLEQSYPHLELCVADDASTDPGVSSTLAEYAAADPRVRIHQRIEHGHICHTSNDALALATGDYVALLDHDDVLARHALLRVAEAISVHPGAKLLYSDEDKLSEDGRRIDPHFKGQFNPDLLLSQAYMGHLLVARTADVRELGGFRPGFEGSQDHDLALRMSERCTAGEVVHVPHVLYHWRQSAGSTAQRPSAKSYAASAGLRAVADALERRGQSARVEPAPLVPHGYRVRFALAAQPPLVSVVVPTRDAAALLRASVGTLLEKTAYPHFELIIVDNGSVLPETFAYLKEVAKDPRVRVLRDDRPFNFSALNNRAATAARGSILAFINNDVEAIHGDWLEEMVSHAVRPDIGCVGAKLLYPDDRVQHAGVITGVGGVAGHAHKYLHKDDPGYFGRAALTHNLSAVTAACLLVRRSVFDEVGGLDETLAVAFNDVDFCLRVRAAGYRNLFTPYAVLYHHESATRGPETTDEGQRRFAAEGLFMKERWGHTLRQDPYYSPHLSLEREDFSIGLGG